MRDHLDVTEEAVPLVRGLRSLMTPAEEGGYGLKAAEVARALGMHPKGNGVLAWTGNWNPRKKRFEGGRNLPQPGPVKDRLARYVDRTMKRWGAGFLKKPASAKPAKK